MSQMMLQAAATMKQLQNKLDVVGHNMANSQTTGYKSRQVEFSSLLSRQIDNMTHPANGQGRLTPDGVRIGSGAKVGSINSDLAVGSIKNTGRELDTALLNDNLLFQIQVTNQGITETQYTRDGSFYVNPVNNNQSLMLTTKDGDPVIGANGPITFAREFDSMMIDDNGQIIVEHENQSEVVGQLAIVEVTRPELLQASGENAFRLPNVEEIGGNLNEMIQEIGINEEVLKSHSLEYSNVDQAEQMTDLLMAQRSYQFNARTLSMGDQMMGLINQIR